MVKRGQPGREGDSRGDSQNDRTGTARKSVAGEERDRQTSGDTAETVDTACASVFSSHHWAITYRLYVLARKIVFLPPPPPFLTHMKLKTISGFGTHIS